ncbi:MAG: hypothetical protein PHH69_06555 [Candidatus Omnitrophica bacterium]|nr:hypothetical protein [Candidatus Omnitrophota bacterium]MDD5611168.1 hypothetical protein [Candidatus Omnitrophota bacterium]
MKRKNSLVQNSSAIIILTLVSGLAGLALAKPCFALDESKGLAISKAFKQDQNKKAAKKTKAAEPKAKSFKRFEISYESMWLRGKYFEEDSMWLSGAFTFNVDYKNKLASRLDVYKMAFYLMPRTYIEGSYGKGALSRKKTGSITANSNLGALRTIAEDHLDGKNNYFWTADLCQNIYTHNKTGISVAAFAGYSDWRQYAKLSADSSVYGSDFYEAKRSYQGARLGLKFKAPFTLPDMAKNPFLLKIDIAYTPDLSLKSKDMFLLNFNRGFSYKGKGYAWEGRAGLSFQITSYLSIEGVYSYYLFKMRKGKYDAITSPFFTSIIADIPNAKTILHGPSVNVKLIF